MTTDTPNIETSTFTEMLTEYAKAKGIEVEVEETDKKLEVAFPNGAYGYIDIHDFKDPNPVLIFYGAIQGRADLDDFEQGIDLLKKEIDGYALEVALEAEKTRLFRIDIKAYAQAAGVKGEVEVEGTEYGHQITLPNGHYAYVGMNDSDNPDSGNFDPDIDPGLVFESSTKRRVDVKQWSDCLDLLKKHINWYVKQEHKISVDSVKVTSVKGDSADIKVAIGYKHLTVAAIVGKGGEMTGFTPESGRALLQLVSEIDSKKFEPLVEKMAKSVKEAHQTHMAQAPAKAGRDMGR